MKISFKALCYLSIFYSQMHFCTTIYAQNFYKWVDKNGSTHYTKTPPPKNAKQLGQVETYSTYPTSQLQNTTPTEIKSVPTTQETLPIHSTSEDTSAVPKEAPPPQIQQKQSGLL